MFACSSMIEKQKGREVKKEHQMEILHYISKKKYEKQETGGRSVSQRQANPPPPIKKTTLYASN